MKWIVLIEVDADTEQEARDKVEPGQWKRLKIVSVEKKDEPYITGAPR